MSEKYRISSKSLAVHRLHPGINACTYSYSKIKRGKIKQRRAGLSNLSAMVGRIHFIFGVASQYAISVAIKAIFEYE